MVIVAYKGIYVVHMMPTKLGYSTRGQLKL